MSLLVTWTEPELCCYDFNLAHAWFVYFDIKNELTGQVLRKQFRGGINYYQTKEKRLEQGNALLSHWKKKLDKGQYNPFVKGAEHNPVEFPENVKDALAKILALKRASLKPKPFRNYRNIHDMFLGWLERFSYHKLRLYQLQPNIAQAYLDYLLIEKEYAGKTHNNQHGILHAFFGAMMVPGRAWIDKNPFAGVRLLPEDIGSNMPYDEKEKTLIIDHLKQFERRMFYAVSFLFHCFIRKTELTTIRVGNIDWQNKTIRINSQAAKNRIQDCVTIPESFLPILLEMELDRAPKHFYIFGKKMLTCADRMTRPDDISDKYLVIKKDLGFEANDNKTFYAWKHTGVIAYWNIIKDPYVIMRQCRHSTLDTTLVYLKSLGLNPNMPFLSAKAEL